MRNAIHASLAALVIAGFGLLATPVHARTNPPPSYVAFIPVCYNSVNGNVRFVKPWGVAGASVPNCTPPSPWATNGPYDPTACNSGGSFDCRTKEYYLELQNHA